MKFACPVCGQLAEAASFRVDGGALLLTCGSCGAENRAETTGASGRDAPQGSGSTAKPGVTDSRPALSLVAAPLDTGPEDAFAAPQGFCPKCIAARPERALACPQCGLVYDNFVAEEHAPSAEVRQQWAQVLANWSAPAAHEALLQWADASAELASVGRLYRIRLARWPADPAAARGRDEVLRRVAVKSLEHDSSVTRSATLSKRTALAITFLVTMLTVAFLIRIMIRYRS